MSSRFSAALVLALSSVGCAAGPGSPARVPEAESAPTLLTVHGEGAIEAYKHPGKPRFIGSADVGFESTGCCALGFYVAASELNSERAKLAKVSEVIDGGVELGVTIPGVDDRFRARARVGKSGTAPKDTSTGRSGISASLALAFRVWEVPPPATGHFSPDIDAVLSFATLALQRESTSAGPMRDPFTENALLLGVRIGTDYGLDLQ